MYPGRTFPQRSRVKSKSEEQSCDHSVVQWTVWILSKHDDTPGENYPVLEKFDRGLDRVDVKTDKMV